MEPMALVDYPCSSSSDEGCAHEPAQDAHEPVLALQPAASSSGGERTTSQPLRPAPRDDALKFPEVSSPNPTLARTTLALPNTAGHLPSPAVSVSSTKTSSSNQCTSSDRTLGDYLRENKKRKEISVEGQPQNEPAKEKTRRIATSVKHKQPLAKKLTIVKKKGMEEWKGYTYLLQTTVKKSGFKEDVDGRWIRIQSKYELALAKVQENSNKRLQKNKRKEKEETQPVDMAQDKEQTPFISEPTPEVTKPSSTSAEIESWETPPQSPSDL